MAGDQEFARFEAAQTSEAIMAWQGTGPREDVSLKALGGYAPHSLIWPKNVQKPCPFAYAPIERHLTLLLTCRLFPRVP